MQKREELENYYKVKTEEEDYIYENAFYLSPQSLNSKIYKVRDNKSYSISRGKSPLFRRALLLFLLALFLGVISALTLNEEDRGYWYEVIKLLPRVLALVAVVLGVLRLRVIKDIPPFIELDAEGIHKEEETYHWKDIEAMYLKTSVFDSNLKILIVHLKDKVVDLDLSNIDEISEDACVVMAKFHEKYHAPDGDGPISDE